MLPIVLVLLVATSALAAPSVTVQQYRINDIAQAFDYGGKLNWATVDKAWELSDGGDLNIYILTVKQILQDMANQPDDYTKALSASQTLAILGELSFGQPGDVCAAAEAINSSVAGGSARSFVGYLRNAIDNIVALANNPNGRRFTRGPSGACYGNGRNYQFEIIWDKILDSASPATIGLVNEEYCAVKRLYNAFNARSNNVGAVATAAAIPEVVNAVKPALGKITNFLRVVANGGNAAFAAAEAKAAIR